MSHSKKMAYHFLVSLTIIAIIPLLLFSVYAESNIDNASASTAAIHKNPIKNLCENKDKCSDCLRTSGCAWCRKPDVSDHARCFLYSESDTEFCKEPEYLYYPKTIETNEIDKSGPFVQIKPQRIKLNMRINEEHNFKFSYTQAKDYPVDLYFLMDLSKSMEVKKDTLSKLGEALSKEMKAITKDFRLGFGSFIDKVVMPFVSKTPESNAKDCTNCVPAYSFKHHMSLDTNATLFAERVKEAPVSGNLDAPEGGFDALVQAIVCDEKIGWRKESRRLLVFSTDAIFHYAGDGKLAGIIAANDGKCHLDTNGYYTHAEKQDYPSIAQINQIAKEHFIHIIFAVTEEQSNVYGKLAKAIDGSTNATLTANSSNIIDIVRDEYKKISSEIEIRDDAPTDNVKISYHTACVTNGSVIETKKCTGIKVNNTIDFTAKIMVTSCPKNKDEWKKVITIKPSHINESLEIELEMLCECECEKPGFFEPNSENCHQHGSYKCGLCECNDKYHGNLCECSNHDLNQGSITDNMCIKDGVVCSGQGTCLCNRCNCTTTRSNPDEIFSGKFCECNNFSCERHDGKLCSGADHGTCDCGQCICNPGWNGSGCECATTTDTCMPPNGKDLCSGNGECKCGACTCNVTENGRYSGKYCEKCPTCSGRCNELQDCVQCLAYEMGPLKNQCQEKCNFFTMEVVDKVALDLNKNEQICVFFDEDDCKYTFKYEEDVNLLKVNAQKERQCEPKVNLLGIVLGLIGAIVLIGVATLLLWKLLTTLHDRREFSRFEKERRAARMGENENPLYKQAVTTFKNPTCGKE